MSAERLTPDEIRALGYEPTPRGWILADLDRRPPPNPHLCRACQKFVGTMAGRLCPGCSYFGKGDPHGLRHRRDPDEVVKFRQLHEPDEIVIEVCGTCKGYMSTGPDGLCDGCAWERSGSSLSFSEWRIHQEEANRKLRWFRDRRPA